MERVRKKMCFPSPSDGRWISVTSQVLSVSLVCVLLAGCDFRKSSTASTRSNENVDSGTPRKTIHKGDSIEAALEWLAANQTEWKADKKENLTGGDAESNLKAALEWIAAKQKEVNEKEYLTAEEIEGDLKLEFLPVLDEQGLPKAFLRMIVNRGKKTWVVKTSEFREPSSTLSAHILIETEKDGEWMVVGTGPSLVSWSGKMRPKEQTYVLDPGMFVGDVLNIDEESLKQVEPHMKAGRTVEMRAIVSLSVRLLSSKGEGMTSCSLGYEDRFMINPYLEKKVKRDENRRRRRGGKKKGDVSGYNQEEEGPKAQASEIEREEPKNEKLAEEVEKCLKLKFSPVLDEKGLPKAFSRMISNVGNKTIVIMTSEFREPSSPGTMSISVETGRGRDEAGCDFLPSVALWPGKKKLEERTYVLDPGTFVGDAVTIPDLSRKNLKGYMKPGRVVTVEGSIAVDAGLEGTKKKKMKCFTLWGENKFVVSPYEVKKTSKDGARRRRRTPSIITSTTVVKEIHLSRQDEKLVLAAVSEFWHITDDYRIVLCERWGEEEGAKIYRIALDIPNDARRAVYYIMSKYKGTWKVLRQVSPWTLP